MKSIFSSLLDSIKHLVVVTDVVDQFDRDERRLVFQALVIGGVVWATVYALKTAVHELFHFVLHWIEHAPTPFVLFGPLIVGAILVATLVRIRSSTIHYRDEDGHIHELLDIEGDGLERAISMYFSSEPTFEQSLLGQEGVDVRWQMPTFTLAARKFLATLVTLGSGGSGGLEASVTMIGESMAAGLFKPRAITNQAGNVSIFQRAWNWWKSTNPDDLQTAQLCGISAAVSTLLGAPFAAGFFAIEVMYRRRPVIEKLVYALISALVAFFLNRLVSPNSTAIFHIDAVIVPEVSLRYYGVIALMAIVVSIVSVYFARLRASFDDGFHHRQPQLYQRHIIGAVVTGLVAIGVYYLLPILARMGAIPESGLEHRLGLVLGPGEVAIDLALAGEMALWVAVVALFAKMIATLATIGSGGSAGLLVPSIFFGTMVATVFAHLFGYDPSVIIIPAITASLVSIVNVPLAAIMLPVELFSATYMVPSLVALVVSSLFAHRTTIYRTQRDTYAGREVLPGYSTRRYRIPTVWQGKNLIELNLRQRYNISVVGLIERLNEAGEVSPHVRLNPDPTMPLTFDDTLVVMGTDDQLAVFSAALEAKEAIEQRAEGEK